jgi:hypothetical protein
MKFKTAVAVEQERAQTQHQMLENKCVEDVYQSFPQLVRCTATSKMILEAIYEFAGTTSVVPTMELFKVMLEANPEFFRASLPNQPVAKRREDLIEEIIGLLGKNGSYSKFNLDTERKRLSVNQWDVAKLEARKAEILEKQRLAKFSTTELRQQLAADRAANAPQRPTLPAEIDAAAIKQMSPAGIKDLIRRFGVAVLNARIAGRS